MNIRNLFVAEANDLLFNLELISSEDQIIIQDFQFQGGCLDNEACNYNSSANFDNGLCLYSDCTGECGGIADLDTCGICNGDGWSCAPPGDVNQDYILDIIDILSIVQHILEYTILAMKIYLRDW